MKRRDPHLQKVHTRSEAFAVGVLAPTTLYIGLTNKSLPDWQRTFLVAAALGTFAVDGYLLWRRR